MLRSEWMTGKSNLEAKVVLVPGLLSDGRVWKSVEDALPDGQCYLADVKQDATIEAMAARILNEIEGPMAVVGHSMGGRVAMEVAHQAPERVLGLVLANTGHHPLKPGEAEKRQTKIDYGYSDFEGMVREWLPPMVAASRHNDKALMANLPDMALEIGPEVHERQIKALVARPNAGEYIFKIACPILLLAGTEDIWSPAAQHQEIKDMARNARLQIFENAGHFLPVEQPDAVARSVSNWLAVLKKVG